MFDFDLEKEIKDVLKAIVKEDGYTSINELMDDVSQTATENELVEDVFSRICDKWDFPTTGKDADEFYKIVQSNVFGGFAPSEMDDFEDPLSKGWVSDDEMDDDIF